MNSFIKYLKAQYKSSVDESEIKEEKKLDNYDKIADLYLELTRDDNNSFTKYKNFLYPKIISKNDIYSETAESTEDKQVHLYNLYKNGKINKKVFEENINCPEKFFTECVDWKEYISVFKGLNNSQSIMKIENIKNKIQKKKFYFDEYQMFYKEGKKNAIFSFLLH